tara:strand:+ start:1899 stop:3542 length:1644 start_codon:yes stop_codon:yes gene_type:complete
MARNSKRRSDKRKVRITKTYSIEEIAILFEKTEGTVLTWIADGLPTIDALEPPLVYGWELKQWHEEWWDRRRKKCAANEFYCCHCQDVRPAEPGTITFSVRVADGIRGVAVCSVCGTSVVRNFSVEHALEAGSVLGEKQGRVSRFNDSDTAPSNPGIHLPMGDFAETADILPPEVHSEAPFVPRRTGSKRTTAVPKNPFNERLKRAYFDYLHHASGRSHKSVSKDEGALLRYESFFKFEDFGTFSSRRAIEYKTYLGSLGLSVTTVVAELRSVRRLLTWLTGTRGFTNKISPLDIDYLNPTMNERRASQSTSTKVSPSVDNALTAFRLMPLTTVIDRRNKAIFALLSLTGVRGGALITLRVKHFDPDRRLLNQNPKEVATKSRKQINTYLFDTGEEFETCFIKWHRYLIDELKYAPDDPLFPKSVPLKGKGGSVGKNSLVPIHHGSTQSISLMVKRSFKRAGLPEFTMHRFRDMLVGEMYRRKLPADKLKAWSQNFGHASVKTTIVSYGKLSSVEQGRLIQESAIDTDDKPLTKKDLAEFFAKMSKG